MALDDNLTILLKFQYFYLYIALFTNSFNLLPAVSSYDAIFDDIENFSFKCDGDSTWTKCVILGSQLIQNDYLETISLRSENSPLVDSISITEDEPIVQSNPIQQPSDSP